MTGAVPPTTSGRTSESIRTHTSIKAINQTGQHDWPKMNKQRRFILQLTTIEHCDYLV